MEMLKSCAFPGNVRELENCDRRAATLTHGDVIRREDLSCAVGECLSSQLWAGGTRGGLFGPDRRARQRPHHRRAGLREATPARSSAAGAGAFALKAAATASGVAGSAESVSARSPGPR
jgi:Nif-specific regulatory protein